MSYDAMLEAMKNDPALAQAIHDAPSAAARGDLLDAAGVARPNLHSPEPTRDQIKEMSEVAGGSGYYVMTACGAA